MTENSPKIRQKTDQNSWKMIENGWNPSFFRETSDLVFKILLITIEKYKNFDISGDFRLKRGEDLWKMTASSRLQSKNDNIRAKTTEISRKVDWNCQFSIRNDIKTLKTSEISENINSNSILIKNRKWDVINFQIVKFLCEKFKKFIFSIQKPSNSLIFQ